MTRVPRWFLKTGFLWLVIGSAMGGLFLILKAFGGWPLWRAFITPHAHIMFVGFITHLIMGVSDWMFPRPRQTRYTEQRAISVLLVLNAGLILRIVSEPWLGLAGGSLPRAMLALSGVLQFLAVALFVFNMWDRIWIPPQKEGRHQWIRKLREPPQS